ncbi:ABC transporter substrate-binding protein [Pusillimonas caeni]|uniref:ABC transporter substrate-binding protein n=1 Tax=Pusillimonas caeni TaxID=1348472 RepID=UPI0014309BDB|nr:ABC transporter substrate-binding protein [Pusillimonas caeni]
MTKSLFALVLAMMALVGPAHAEQGVSSDTIKIGVFAPLTGSASIFGRAAYGAEAVYREVNEQGGIHGRKIEVIREDDACDPARAISAVRKMTSQEHVFLIHGGVCSGTVMAVRDDLERQNVPFVILGAASAGIVDPFKKNLFQPIPNSDVVAVQMADFAMSKPGAKKIAIISHTDEWGKTNSEVATKHLKEKYGIDLVANVAIERGSADATPQVLQLRQSKPDAVLAMLYPAETAILVRDAHKYAMKTPIIGNFGVSLEDTRDRVRNMDAMKNFYTFYAYTPALGSPEIEPWTRMITKYFPDHRADNFSYEGMGGSLAVIEALRRAGPDLTRDKFIAAMESIENFETEILNSPITFSATDHAGVKGGAMTTYRDGKAVVLRTWDER